MTQLAIVAFPESQVSLLDAFTRSLNSDLTRSVYTREVEAFDAWLGDKAVLTCRARDVEAYRAYREAEGDSAATIAKRLSALSAFYTFAMREDEIGYNPAAQARRPKVSDTSPRQGLSPREVEAMLHAAAQGPTPLAGLRDVALVSMLAFQITRLRETLDLQIGDLGEELGHRVATLRRKHHKIMRVPLAAPTWQALSTWVQAAQLSQGPVFLPVTQLGTPCPGKAMSSQAAEKIVKRIAAKAGLDPAKVHPHLFRHGGITAALDQKVPLAEVQDHAGHADPKTTRRYDSHRGRLNNPTGHVLAGIYRGSTP